LPPAVTPRRFPPPWTIEEHNNACFIVRDRGGQALAYFYFEERPADALPPICSPRTRRGGWRRTSPSCRNCCGGRRREPVDIYGTASCDRHRLHGRILPSADCMISGAASCSIRNENLKPLPRTALAPTGSRMLLLLVPALRWPSSYPSPVYGSRTYPPFDCLARSLRISSATLVFDSRTSSANGACGRHDRQESAGMRPVSADQG
jgi:hypothetical protein